MAAHLNENSLRNKFDLLVDQTNSSPGALNIFEVKLSNPLPLGQFRFKRYAFAFSQEWESLVGGATVLMTVNTPFNYLPAETKSVERF